jgi:hypothetical protein
MQKVAVIMMAMPTIGGVLQASDQIPENRMNLGAWPDEEIRETNRWSGATVTPAEVIRPDEIGEGSSRR